MLNLYATHNERKIIYMKKNEYAAPELSLAKIETRDVMTASSGYDSEDNWHVDPFALT